MQKQFSDTSDNLYDPFGQNIGTHDVPANDWYDQDVKFAGRNLVYFSQSGAGTRFFHVNALDSVGYSTRPTGAPFDAILYYPFGSTWQDTTGAIWDERFASLPDNDADMQLYETLAREYSPGLGC